jgi:hypothetical protein
MLDELDGPGIEFRWKRDFPHPSRPALGPIEPPIQLLPGHSWEVKLPGRGVNHPPTPNTGVKEKVELYVHSRLGLHGLF